MCDELNSNQATFAGPMPPNTPAHPVRAVRVSKRALHAAEREAEAVRKRLYAAMAAPGVSVCGSEEDKALGAAFYDALVADVLVCLDVQLRSLITRKPGVVSAVFS
jgi:hypothetical protein